MAFELIDTGGSRSFPVGDAFRSLATPAADVAVILGGDSTAVARALAAAEVAKKRAVLVELGTECLGFHTGETRSEMRAGRRNVVGFARFRMGDAAPSPLIELVRQPGTPQAALDTAQAMFEGAGLEVSVCADVPGRIVDSLLRPYLNSALRSLDEGLADAETLDRALRLGLGYPRGPIELLEQTGMEAHHHVAAELHAALGAPELVPARRARVAAQRKKAGLS
jgi:3-hydroxybutyryl-CoA dehydrogenase